MPYKDATYALHYSYEHLRGVKLVASSLRREDVLRDIREIKIHVYSIRQTANVS